MPYIVALTGGIGSGKSEAAKIFTHLGVRVVDVDVISHQLTASGMPLLKHIRQAFGDGVFDANGDLNRAKLRALVFQNADARMQLNAILHPAIFEEALNQLRSQPNASYQVLAIPLLDASSPYLPYISRILAVDCEESAQIARVQARSGLAIEEIKRIIATQTPRAERLQLADDVLKNNDSLQEMALKIKDLHEKYLKYCIVSKTIS